MKKMAVKLIISGVFGMMVFSTLHAADTNEQANIVFNEGAVHIYCFAAEDANSEVFLEAFPKLIANIQIHANEGRVTRAHYLKELMHGIFIVVAGDTGEEAKANADQLLAENAAIFNTAFERAGEEVDEDVSSNTCRTLAVGPVAVLPNK